MEATDEILALFGFPMSSHHWVVILKFQWTEIVKSEVKNMRPVRQGQVANSDSGTIARNNNASLADARGRQFVFRSYSPQVQRTS